MEDKLLGPHHTKSHPLCCLIQLHGGQQYTAQHGDDDHEVELCSLIQPAGVSITWQLFSDFRSQSPVALLQKLFVPIRSEYWNVRIILKSEYNPIFFIIDRDFEWIFKVKLDYKIELFEGFYFPFCYVEVLTHFFQQ